MTWFLTLAVFALAAWCAHMQARHAEFRRATNERLHAADNKQTELEELLAKQNETIDGMAKDWTAIFGNVKESWTKHIEQVSEKVATQLSLEKHVPKARR